MKQTIQVLISCNVDIYAYILVKIENKCALVLKNACKMFLISTWDLVCLLRLGPFSSLYDYSLQYVYKHLWNVTPCMLIPSFMIIWYLRVLWNLEQTNRFVKWPFVSQSFEVGILGMLKLERCSSKYYNSAKTSALSGLSVI